MIFTKKKILSLSLIIFTLLMLASCSQPQDQYTYYAVNLSEDIVLQAIEDLPGTTVLNVDEEEQRAIIQRDNAVPEPSSFGVMGFWKIVCTYQGGQIVCWVDSGAVTF